ncbi:MAG: 2-oxoacid:acceptor oxidoreductase family protein [Candidatus Lokiarchaeota archaeon]|nr:2-oxoacid:acceptor oxidoreductase family protein [Candidatus Harpocratesius repetitus]
MSDDIKKAPRYLIRFHGRGGQGAVTAAQLCAMAFNGPATCMPTFGAERMGSPVASFVKLSKDFEKVRTNEQVYSPQYVAVLDDTLLSDVDCTAGMVPGGYLVINTCRPIEEVREIISKNNPPAINIALIDATNIALEYLGRNITNTLILGALLKVAPELFTIEQLSDAIADQFNPKIAQKNMDAIKVVPDATTVYPADGDVKISYETDYKKQWSHVKPDLIGVKEWDLAGVWYVDKVDGGSKRVNTGAWGVSVAQYHPEYCIQCGNCVFVCPDFCILREEVDGKWQVVGVDEFHCKGCGNCVAVCPGKKDKETGEKHKALTMVMKC